MGKPFWQWLTMKMETEVLFQQAKKFVKRQTILRFRGQMEFFSYSLRIATHVGNHAGNVIDSGKPFTEFLQGGHNAAIQTGFHQIAPPLVFCANTCFTMVGRVPKPKGNHRQTAGNCQACNFLHDPFAAYIADISENLRQVQIYIVIFMHYPSFRMLWFPRLC